MAAVRDRARQFLRDAMRIRTAQPDDADPAAAGRRGDRDDGVGEKTEQTRAPTEIRLLTVYLRDEM